MKQRDFSVDDASDALTNPLDIGKIRADNTQQYIGEKSNSSCKYINRKAYYGDEYTVNTGLLGDEMNGSINIHNHVTGQSQYSFSKEDLVESIRDGSYISYAYDERFLYTMIIKNKIPADLAEQLYEEARLEVDDILFHNPELIPLGDEQHERIKRACEKFGIA